MNQEVFTVNADALHTPIGAFPYVVSQEELVQCLTIPTKDTTKAIARCGFISFQSVQQIIAGKLSLVQRVLIVRVGHLQPVLIVLLSD